MTQRTAVMSSDLLKRMRNNVPALIVMTASLALAVVILVVADPTQFINAVATGGMWALLAVGLALIFGVANVPYFAHGESFMVGAYTAYYVYSPIKAYLEAHPNEFLTLVAPFAGMVGAAIVGFVLGIFLERLLFLPLRRATKAGEWVMNAFLLTLGISFIMINGTTLLIGPNFVGVPEYWNFDALQFLGMRISVDRVVSFVIAVLTIAALWLFLHRTQTGRAIRAVSQDEVGAESVGINPDFVYALTFGLATSAAALAGGSLIFLFQAYPTVGGIPLYFAWYVVILAGLGNIAGAIIGGFIVALLQTATQQFIGIGWSNVVPVAVMIIVLILVPSGIFGSEVKGIQER